MTRNELLNKISSLVSTLTATAMYTRRADGFTEEFLESEIRKTIDIKINAMIDDAITFGYNMGEENRIPVSDLAHLNLNYNEDFMNKRVLN